MEKEFVEYEQALELKELGFDEPCIACWSNRKSEDYYLYFGGIEYVEDGGYANLMKDTTISAPLYQQVFRWFREEYNFHHYIEPIHRNGKVCYEYCVVDSSEDEKEFNEDNIVSTYEEAELECLKKLIELVREK